MWNSRLRPSQFLFPCTGSKCFSSSSSWGKALFLLPFQLPFRRRACFCSVDFSSFGQVQLHPGIDPKHYSTISLLHLKQKGKWEKKGRSGTNFIVSSLNILWLACFFFYFQIYHQKRGLIVKKKCFTKNFYSVWGPSISILKMENPDYYKK